MTVTLGKDDLPGTGARALGVRTPGKEEQWRP